MIASAFQRNSSECYRFLDDSAKAGGFSIEPMRLTDLPEVLAIERCSFAAPWSQLAFEAEMEKTYASLRVARPQGSGKGRPVFGYICVWLVADEIQIANLAVHIWYRRRGVGLALLLHACTEGYSAGARLAVLEVARKNTAALALYERMGFVLMQKRPRYYPESRDDALIMELKLRRLDVICKILRRPTEILPAGKCKS